MNIFENIWPDWFLYYPENPMFYTSLMFWVLFTGFLGFYSLVYSRQKLRNIYLLVISLFFYFKINGVFLMLLLSSCLFNYIMGLLISLSHQKKIWLALAILINLLVLGFYKYAYFITETLNQLLETNFVTYNWLNAFWNQLSGDTVDVKSIALPIGISFYTFQAISYLVDVYRQHAKAVRNILDFSFYLSFFPQLVAGPIVRAASFIPQLYKKYKLNKAEFSYAVFIILKGLFKKIVIADFLAINFVDRIFDSPLSYSGLENLLAVYAYSVQIYCDFSGYTDIAIGLALVMGFKIPVNFNMPYQAISLTDFWHRWHISLSLWLRDYLYIPLGGNRKGKARTYINIMLTMIVGGIWHGAGIQFLYWGLVHGIGLVLEKMISVLTKTIRIKNKAIRFFSAFITFQFVSFAWIFFRSENMEKVREMIYRMHVGFMPDIHIEQIQKIKYTLIVLAVGLILIWFPYRWKEKWRGLFISSPMIIQILFAVIVLLIISRIGSMGLQPFIYFRF